MSSVASELEQQVLAPPGIELLATHDSDWAPHACSVTLNVTLDACIVPTSSGEARLDTAHVVVLDDFFGEPEREELLSFITQPGGLGPSDSHNPAHILLPLLLLSEPHWLAAVGTAFNHARVPL